MPGGGSWSLAVCPVRLAGFRRVAGPAALTARATRVHPGRGGQGPTGDPAGEDEHLQLTTLAGWRGFVTEMPAVPDLLPEAIWTGLEPGKRACYDDDRIVHHSRLLVVQTPVIRQVINSGRRLIQLNKTAHWGALNALHRQPGSLTKAPRRAPSERQRPALRELVHVEARHLRERAAAVGVAGQERPAADRPGEAARRVSELPVPPVTCKLSCCVPLNKQLCRLIEEPGHRSRAC